MKRPIWSSLFEDESMFFEIKERIEKYSCYLSRMIRISEVKLSRLGGSISFSMMIGNKNK